MKYFIVFLFGLLALASCKSDKSVATDDSTALSDTVATNQATAEQSLAMPKAASTPSALPVAPTPDDALLFTVAKVNVDWIGSKTTGSSHVGIIKGSTGRFGYKNGNLVSGNVSIDMKTLMVTQMEDPDKAKLESHLKGEDFFDVNKYPTASFELVSVDKFDPTKSRGVLAAVRLTHTITGNLTIKGITRTITFPANIVINLDYISVTSAMFNIKRTDWGVNYDQDKISGKIKDAFVNDEISIMLTVQANKKAQ